MRGQPDSAAVQALLGRILASQSFAQSARLRDVLEFVVLQSLAGKQDEIKESVIAAEVFKKTDYDSRTDSLVRVTTSSLRSKLLEYYSGPGADEPIGIEIPKGSYSPVLFFRREPAESVGRRWWMAGAAGMAACAGLFVWRREPPAGRTIAVLPFLDLSAEKNLEYFCDGLTEELIDRLAHLKDIDVIARTSAFHYKGKAQDIRQIGRALGASTVVEGSVRRSGESLRVTVQLNRADSGAHVWSQVYEIRMGEIFATQDKIVAAVEKAVGEPRTENQRVFRRAHNLDAWEHLLRGRVLMAGNTAGAHRATIAEFEKALALDPEFALVHAELARCMNNLVLTGGMPHSEAAEAATSHAAESVRLDAELALGHAVLGRCLLMYSWDWQGCEQASRRAVELAPGSELALTNLGIVLADRGRSESIGLLRRAKRIDPLYWGAPQQLARALYLTRSFDECVKTAEEAIRAHRDIVPLWFRNYISISLGEGARGNLGRAIEAAELGWAHEKQRMNVGWIGLAGWAYAKAGNRDKAGECLKQLGKQTRPVSPVYFARIFMGLGDADRAFEFLTRAVDARDPNLTWVNADPRSDFLRRDARWGPLMKRIGLT